MSVRDKRGAKVDLDRPNHDLWTYLISVNRDSPHNIRAISALMLRLLGNLSLDQIARVLKTHRGRVSRLLRRGRLIARTHLQAEEPVEVSLG
ncbi:hypothetical protein Plim_4303 (plasmid) [Planctopirus limnophila DSM 3776]|uniref:Uncharacterized protein n=1 Tax=Planctopirus limnophila (strain ATCC 43296 / DSM 3776 / IFAM 1008 / Mu 290) TaxID=521674 RepID=D5SZJ0_PLAL2|nr:sigma-70 family RNA polymerase sigma factor [Planctopirus limnophila]ADG70110.1 hypothetical protein Plim_4303 [Planctopirus limnophila DSM 3776]